MSFEDPNVEKSEGGDVIGLTREEFDILSRAGNPDDEERIRLMAEKGISFDSGNIEITVDGEKKTITTRKDDFGTIVINRNS